MKTLGDILTRAAKTAIQGFVGAAGALPAFVWATGVPIDLSGLKLWAISGTVGAASAVASLVMNALINWAATK